MRLSATIGMVLLCCCGNRTSEAEPPKPGAVALPGASRPGAGAPDQNVDRRPSLHIVSYNVNADMADDPNTMTLLRELDADVILLQEVGTAWQRKLSTELTDLYPHRHFRSAGERWGGLAVLSRHSIEKAETLPASEGPFEATIVTVSTPMSQIRLLNLHLFPPVRWARERGWLRAYRDSQDVHLREIRGFLSGQLESGLPLIIAGDFNEDSNGKAMLWLQSQGFVRANTGSEPTWRWQTSYGEVSWQLDHILHTADLEAIEAATLDGGGSDHVPVALKIRMRSSQREEGR